MQKLLISILLCASLALTACSIDRIPWVHRIDIPQGNIVTQRMVNQLKPGMTHAQVRFILGTSLTLDPFQADRWDYVYMNKHPNGKMDESRVTVFFHNGLLAKVEGNLRPQPHAAPAPRREVMVEVPPKTVVHRGLLVKFWLWIRQKG
ncbi:MAG: hypothetical protein B7Z66_09420 [Chromatiales bacterium 21-64-14]|nr:MAG: hypothetical protein B7Z66_09420 [Chromatiales bacterium 21-64-14]HQU16174.1 outer membrane protein assembly factor BamE [Gammaproteobacteria bacterium]